MKTNIKLTFKSGMYPITRQMWFDKFDQELYNEVFENYKQAYKLDNQLTFDYKYDDTDIFYLNKTAFLILNNQRNIIKSFAFKNFSDLTWIFKLINNEGLSFVISVELYNQLEKENKNNFNCFNIEK